MTVWRTYSFVRKKCFIFLSPSRDREKDLFIFLLNSNSGVTRKYFMLPVGFCRIQVIYSVIKVGDGESQERVWFVLIMMLGRALRLFLQVPKSRAYLLT